jgi:tetratricopeptide (TPR) repeat protein
VSPGPVLVSLALLSSALQGDRPQLEASVDEDRLSVGEELLYTLRAVSHSPMPMQVTLAPFTGLEVVGRSERTEVGLSGGPVRTSVVEYRLRAVRPGHWQVGPARAVQGGDTVEAAAIVVDVAANRAATATTLSPELRRMLDRAPPPPLGQPAVDLLVSTDTVRVGEQVDVVTAAWFPRDLRLQLRRPPTLQPPVIDGVWSFPQSTPTGIAATRNIRGRWYDVFVSHQVVFPLVAGTVVIPRATLKYSTPVALQFFSQEERFALSSRADTLQVRMLPDAGRPTDFAGAIGVNLALERRVDPAIASVGEGVAVELRLSGTGNTALWPTPELRWPADVRAYLERVDEQVATLGGHLGGTKTFRYLVVPDSAGALALPAVRYPYFDLGTDRYAEVGLAGASIPVTKRGDSPASAALPPELMEDTRPALAWSVAHRVSDVLWMLLVALPPLLVWGWARRPWRRRSRAPRSIAGERDALRSAEGALDDLVRTLAPDPDRRFGAALTASVRAAGADAELAARVAAVRERLLARRYGPETPQPDDATLAAEAEEVVRRLGGSLRGWQRQGGVLLLVLMLCAAATAAAQNPAAEELYQRGALHAAAAGFARRVEEAPAVAAHWYDLGAAYYRLGERGRAEAAWLEARRLAPRAPEIRRALELTPPSDIASARWTWSPPVTAEEVFLLGILGWVIGWAGWAFRPRFRERWAVVLVVAAGALISGLALRQWYRRPLAIVVDAIPLRLSPHGRAPEITPVEGGSAVLIVGRVPGWLLVRAAGEREGWVPNDAVATVGG